MRGLSMVLVMVGMLAMAQLSMQYSFRNPIRMPATDDRITHPGSAFAIVVSSYRAEKALNDSGLFCPESYVDLSGRRFVSGKIYGSDVVYVRSASTPSVHVGVTVEILVKNFPNIQGIIHYGGAGTTNETICIGTVVVPAKFNFPGAFTWLSMNSSQEGQLNVGDFNYPKPGENLLGSFLYDHIDLYVAGKRQKKSWIPVSPSYLRTAAMIGHYEKSFNITVGLNASSSDIYVKNPAYREFIFMNFDSATVDTSGAAVALGALSNNVPFVVFHGVSNKAGAGSGESNSTLANANAFKAVASFIWLKSVPRTLHK